jgi:hypothetical protein
MAEYLVGFDRFVALDWANYAVELSSHSDNDSEKKAQLKSWLSSRVSGRDAIRKTANVLTRLWVDLDPEKKYFRNEAHQIILDAKKEDRVIFHWGMALLVFPFFHETCLQAGRLLSLQSSFTRREIHVRIAEKYSNQGTIPRSIDRILQSLVDWRLLEKASSQNLEARNHKTTDLLVKKWLLEVVVYSAPQRRIPLSSFYKLPELFAFEFNGDVAQIANTSNKVRIERDGGNLEYINWRYSE